MPRSRRALIERGPVAGPGHGMGTARLRPTDDALAFPGPSQVVPHRTFPPTLSRPLRVRSGRVNGQRFHQWRALPLDDHVAWVEAVG